MEVESNNLNLIVLSVDSALSHHFSSFFSNQMKKIGIDNFITFFHFGIFRDRRLSVRILSHAHEARGTIVELESEITELDIRKKHTQKHGKQTMKNRKTIRTFGLVDFHRNISPGQS